MAVFQCDLLPPVISCHRLKTVEMVIRNTQGAEGVLKQYEDCLREVHTVPSSVKEVETYKTNLKVSSVPPFQTVRVFNISSLARSLLFTYCPSMQCSSSQSSPYVIVIILIFHSVIHIPAMLRNYRLTKALFSLI